MGPISPQEACAALRASEQYKTTQWKQNSIVRWVEGESRMGLCRYCGRPAGLFRRQHRDCADNHNRALELIEYTLADALNDTTPAKALRGKLNQIALDGFVG